MAGNHVAAPMAGFGGLLCHNRCSMEKARHDEWLRNDLTAVAAALSAFRLDLAGDGLDAERVSLRETIIHHLLPRTDDSASPLVVAVVGPAGSGKSSLVNAMAEARLAPTGAIRPGTRYPVFWTDAPLPLALETLRTSLGGIAVDGERRAPDGMVIVDTPPPDVEGPDGIRPVDAILESADACVFVASGLRYADASGWDLLEVAARRGIPTVFVLNKLPADPSVQMMLREDLARRLAGRGMLSRPDPELVLGIPASRVIDAVGGPAPAVVAMLRKELDAIADPQARVMVSRDVLESGLADAASRLAVIREAAIEERRLRLGLAAIASDAYRLEADTLRRGAEAGDLTDIHGDTDRLVADLTIMATLRAGRAARAASDAWDLHPAGMALIGRHPGLWTHGPHTVKTAQVAAEGWVASLPGLVLTWMEKRRMWRRKLARLTGLVRRATVDNAWVPDAKSLRQLSRLDGAVVAARKDLGFRFETVLDADVVRFTDVLGPQIPASVIDRLGPAEGGSRE